MGAGGQTFLTAPQCVHFMSVVKNMEKQSNFLFPLYSCGDIIGY